MAFSFYVQAPDGRYGQWHEDPEHGDWPEVCEIGRERLEELERHNRHMIPSLQILGKSRADGESILSTRRLFAYHTEISTGEVFGRGQNLIDLCQKE